MSKEQLIEEAQMKVFISQPMKGFTKAEIQNQRAEAQKAIEKRFKGKIEFLGTKPKDIDLEPPEGANCLDRRIAFEKEKIVMLSNSLKILAKADVLMLIKPKGALPNGCFIEASVARRYGIKVIVYRPDYGSGWEEFG
jgi:hypothetical protein